MGCEWQVLCKEVVQTVILIVWVAVGFSGVVPSHCHSLQKVALDDAKYIGISKGFQSKSKEMILQACGGCVLDQSDHAYCSNKPMSDCHLRRERTYVWCSLYCR